jgi:CDP-diglyceride synthetase
MRERGDIVSIETAALIGWVAIITVLVWRAWEMYRAGRHAIAALYAVVSLHFIRILIDPMVYRAFIRSEFTLVLSAFYVAIAVFVLHDNLNGKRR